MSVSTKLGDQLKNFFDRLYCYCDGQVEIRVLPQRAQAFFNHNKIEVIEKYFSRWPESNIYYGVASRDGQGGRLENLIHVPALWCDADFKEVSRVDLYESLNRFPCKPSMIIKSGFGAHLYWLLAEPAEPKDFDRVVDANRRIAAFLGGDRAATDVARILRPPGTFNRKYDPPRPVELTVIDQFEYEIQFFLDELPPAEARPGGNAGGSVNPARWLVEALRGVGQGERNITATKIGGYFLDKLPRRDIEVILVPWGERCTPALPEREIQQVIGSIYRYKKLKNWEPNNGEKKIKLFHD